MNKCTENWDVQRPQDHVLSTETSGHGGRTEIKETQTERRRTREKVGTPVRITGSDLNER